MCPGDQQEKFGNNIKFTVGEHPWFNPTSQFRHVGEEVVRLLSRHSEVLVLWRSFVSTQALRGGTRTYSGGVLITERRNTGRLFVQYDRGVGYREYVTVSLNFWVSARGVSIRSGK